MDAQENIRTVKQLYEPFERGDIPNLLDRFTDELEWFVPGPPQIIPYAGLRRSPQQLAEYFRLLNEALEFEHYAPQEFAAIGDQMVVVLGQSRVRVKATGQKVESSWVHLFTLREGKVAKFHEYYVDFCGNPSIEPWFRAA